MFERFTDRARRVIVLAQEEARQLNHNYVGTEHILLGLIREGHGVAVQVLVRRGIDLERARGRHPVRRQAERDLRRSRRQARLPPRPGAGLRPLTSARRLGFPPCGTCSPPACRPSCCHPRPRTSSAPRAFPARTSFSATGGGCPPRPVLRPPRGRPRGRRPPPGRPSPTPASPHPP